MTDQQGPPDPRRGMFGRLTAIVYWYLLTEIAFLVAAAPGFAGILLLDRSASNIPLYALCALPVLLAFSAAIATMAAPRDELSVWRRFWRAWRRNLVEVLLVTVPALLAASVLGLNIAFGGVAGNDAFFTVASVVLLVALALWTMHALTIAALFRFRVRDIMRLALYYLAARPQVTLGMLCLLIVATAVVGFGSDWVLALLGVFFAAFAVTIARPMTSDIRARFTEPG